jgi:hypothetical protein
MPWWNPPHAPGWLAYGLGDDNPRHATEPDWSDVFEPDHWRGSPSLRPCGQEGCSTDVWVHPNYWDERLQLEYGLPGICTDHCADHDFEHEPGEGLRCIHCFAEPEPGYYDHD